MPKLRQLVQTIWTYNPFQMQKFRNISCLENFIGYAATFFFQWNMVPGIGFSNSLTISFKNVVAFHFIVEFSDNRHSMAICQNRIQHVTLSKKFLCIVKRRQLILLCQTNRYENPDQIFYRFFWISANLLCWGQIIHRNTFVGNLVKRGLLSDFIHATLI